MKRKVAAALLAGTMVLMAAGCGNNNTKPAEDDKIVENTATDGNSSNLDNMEPDSDDSSYEVEDATEGVNTEGSISEGKEKSGNDNNELIVYFAVAENSDVDAYSSASVDEASGFGYTKLVADMIQTITGADEFSITTGEKYAGDYEQLMDDALTEQNDDFRPILADVISDFDNYDIVFVVYPLWWGDLPMPLYSFFEEYDFSGKTIVPFATHKGSQYGESMESIKELEPDAEVREGLAIDQDDVAGASESIEARLDELGY